MAREWAHGRRGCWQCDTTEEVEVQNAMTDANTVSLVFRLKYLCLDCKYKFYWHLMFVCHGHYKYRRYEGGGLIKNITRRIFKNVGNCCVLSEFNLLSNFHSENKSFWVLLVGRLVDWHVSNSNKMFLNCLPEYFCQITLFIHFPVKSHIKQCSVQYNLPSFRKLVKLL